VRRQAQRDAALDLQMPKCEEIQSAAVVGALQISRSRTSGVSAIAGSDN
jgi:hypothetical protein